MLEKKEQNTPNLPISNPHTEHREYLFATKDNIHDSFYKQSVAKNLTINHFFKRKEINQNKIR